jgi:hypothetical protein
MVSSHVIGGVGSMVRVYRLSDANPYTGQFLNFIDFWEKEKPEPIYTGDMTLRDTITYRCHPRGFEYIVECDGNYYFVKHGDFHRIFRSRCVRTAETLSLGKWINGKYKITKIKKGTVGIIVEYVEMDYARVLFKSSSHIFGMKPCKLKAQNIESLSQDKRDWFCLTSLRHDYV